jgi:hypothetical protein
MNPAHELPDQSWKAVVEIAQPKEVETYLVTEMFKALGLRKESRWRNWLKPVIAYFVRGFSFQAAAFDKNVARQGFHNTAGEWLLKWIPGIDVMGQEQIPVDGPLLIVANHPGTYDGLAIASVVPREDLRIVAAGNPFFRSLPSTRQYFIYSTLDTYVRMTTLRNALRHLQAGGALLIFPSGKLDPDPLFYEQEARQALKQWSDSMGLFLRKVPQTKLVVAINSGFVAPEYLHHPLMRLLSGREGRQKLAEFFQVIAQVVFNRPASSQRPRIVFSEPLTFSLLANNPMSIHTRAIAMALFLLEVDLAKRKPDLPG